MAKEFKDFDRLYSEYKGKFFAYEDASDLKCFAAETVRCFRSATEAVAHTNKDIRYAVYEGIGFEDWQKFRVSLKGCSTAMKLARLEWRWHYFTEYCGECDAAGKLIVSEELRNLEHIRIDNYIYALRRGGQLDAEFCIAK